MAPSALPHTQPPRVLRVSELLAGLRDLVADEFPALWVVGEVSNLRQPASGHVYFTLKDDRAQLRCVLFRREAARLLFELENGQDLLAFGRLDLYEARGDLQLIARQVEPRGQGALQLAFEQLRARLAREGLFDPERKRPLPAAPTCVGLVTSAHGAALRDVVRVARERAPRLRLILAATRVQGAGAEGEIAAGLQALVAHGAAQVILLARGGGSLEDLWAFNTEVVARAVARCPLPVVTGIGHETDLCIADLVADAQASTPSTAAAAVFPDRALWRERAERLAERLAAAAGGRAARARERLDATVRDLTRHSPAARLSARRMRLARAHHELARAARMVLAARRTRLREPATALLRPPAGLHLPPRRARLNHASGALRRLAERRVERARGRLAVAASTLDSLSPLAVLGRGYAIARHAGSGRVIRSPTEVQAGDAISVRVRDGTFAARATAADTQPDDQKS